MITDDKTYKISDFIISTHPDVVVRISLDCIFLEISPSMKTVFGYDPKDLIGTTSHLLVHPCDSWDNIDPFLKGEIDIATFTYRIKHAAGHYVWTETTVTSIKDPLTNKPKEILSINRDITARKKLVEQLIEAENLSVASKLAAGVAHEIRNPLTTIKGFLQLLSTESPTKLEYVSLMLSEIERIESITHDLMLLAKPTGKPKKQFNVRKIIEEVMLLLEIEAYKSKVQFMIEPIDNPIYILCDEAKIKQVFINMIKNGIEAMENGGLLKVTLENRDKTICISIADEGTGIAEKDFENLGEAFFTTKMNGNGLGLMMCNKIIKEHNGTIKVHSKLNHGTTFEILLPKN